MSITLTTAKGSEEVSFDAGDTLLDVLQDNDIVITASCGGKGKCGKCSVMVKDAEGVETKLACMTAAQDGLEIILESELTLTVQDKGMKTDYPIDVREEGVYGVAFDVGTTTVVCHLHDLHTGERLATASTANPQIVFGSDVISRITASEEGKLQAMHEILHDTLNDLVMRLCKQEGIDRSSVKYGTLAGNTVIQHIADNLPPDTIGKAPFTTLSLFDDYRDMGNPPYRTYFTPAIAAYVGGDITAGILATDFHRKERPNLFLDIGTNGEMVIGGKERMVSCATAAGPAFEGVGITFGMPASPGGISIIEFNNGKLETSVIGDTHPIGLCGSALLDAVAILLDEGALDSSGHLAKADEVDGPIAAYLGREQDWNVFYLTEDHSVYLTQKDIRSLQLAKAAIHAGIRTMLQVYDVQTSDIEQLFIAGGFGSFIRLENAAKIGLFPAELLDRAIAVGNTAGEGASAALVSTVAREQLRVIGDNCEYVELSSSPVFSDHFINQMEF